MTIRLCDPYEPRMWARHWGRWDAHDVADFCEEMAYWRGRREAAEEIYERLRPFIRLALLDAEPWVIPDWSPEELRDVHELMHGPIQRLMAQAIRRMEQRRTRLEADAAARAEREWTAG